MTAVKRYLVEYADWSHREYLAIAKNLLLGRVHRGPDIEKLRQALAKMYAPAGVHLLNYGHHAIEIALEIFKEQRPGRLEVIGPAYICPSVPSSVARRGLQWRSVDVGEDLNIDAAAVKSAIGSNTLAVIAPHMYGCPADIQSIETICKDAGIYLIDDAAQAVGIKHGDRLLGTFGDVGILSFAQSKMVVTGVRGSGGGLLVNDHTLERQISERCATFASSSGRIEALAHFFWNYLAAPYTGSLGYYIWRVVGIFNRSTDDVGIAQIGNIDAAVAVVQLARIQSIIAAKQKVLNLYNNVIKNYPRMRLPQYRQDASLARVVVELTEDVNFELLAQEVLRRGIQLRSAYPPVCSSGDAACQKNYVNSVVGVPSGRKLNKGDVERICAVLDSAINGARQN